MSGLRTGRVDWRRVAALIAGACAATCASAAESFLAEGVVKRVDSGRVTIETASETLELRRGERDGDVQGEVRAGDRVVFRYSLELESLRRTQQAGRAAESRADDEEALPAPSNAVPSPGQVDDRAFYGA